MEKNVETWKPGIKFILLLIVQTKIMDPVIIGFPNQLSLFSTAARFFVNFSTPYFAGYFSLSSSYR
ncbi:hypothetical protein C5167_040066 [Papaver somniferum]|uniref:Uncharacterized protein n=1 Tax=Papaver somniferum TaxID=3469 RepID=A0A4Y7II75_PAPSO|nr:hypothetical protein C5167_040066 [Papaver somniferum]